MLPHLLERGAPLPWASLAVIFAAFMKVLSSSVFGDMPEGMEKGEVKIWGLAPLAVLGLLLLGCSPRSAAEAVPLASATSWRAGSPSRITVQAPQFPLLCLIVSGGHTDLVLMRAHGRYVLLGATRDERAQRVGELLGAVGLGDRGASMPRELSGGELQRVAVARALVHRPALVLADEPTGNLDPDTAQTVLDLLGREIRSRGAGGVLVTHSEAAARSADRIVVLDHGKLREHAAA